LNTLSEIHILNFEYVYRVMRSEKLVCKSKVRIWRSTQTKVCRLFNLDDIEVMEVEPATKVLADSDQHLASESGSDVKSSKSLVLGSALVQALEVDNSKDTALKLLCNDTENSHAPAAAALTDGQETRRRDDHHQTAADARRQSPNLDVAPRLNCGQGLQVLQKYGLWDCPVHGCSWYGRHTVQVRGRTIDHAIQNNFRWTEPQQSRKLLPRCRRRL
jgi:hypothetical protein